MASTQRPRPRARKASADAPSLTSAAAGSSSSAAKASVSPNPDVNGGGGEDDNDDFFVRRKPASGIKTVSVPVGVFSRGSPMQHLAATEEENEFDDDGDDDDDDNEGSDGSAGGLSSDEGRKRKRPRRRQMPLWAKSTSLSKAEAALKLSKSSRLPLDSRAHTISTDSEGLRGEMKSKQRESRSPSLTPPPPLGKDTLDRLHALLEQHDPAKSLQILEDDDSFLEEHEKVSNLDPDLVRMMKSDRARELRRLAKEQEAQRKDMEEKARREGSSTVSTSDAQSVPISETQRMEVIQVQDSDDEEDAAPNDSSSSRGRRQVAHAYSSSPVQIVSPPPPLRRANVVSPPAEPTESATCEASDASLLREEEEEEHITITLRGGEGGSLKALVTVKPTTQIKKLLDHFVNTHKQSIPANKRKSARLRFDGDWIAPTATIGSIDIEDEEQIDVVW